MPTGRYTLKPACTRTACSQATLHRTATMMLLRRASDHCAQLPPASATRPLRQPLPPASTTPQPIHDALRQVLQNGTKKKRKFDESVDLDVTLNVDPRKPLQAVRGVVSLPHGVGRSVVVAAVSDDPAAQENAKAAGADVVGGEDLVDRVADGYVEFDACVATADMAPLLKRKARARARAQRIVTGREERGHARRRRGRPGGARGGAQEGPREAADGAEAGRPARALWEAEFRRGQAAREFESVMLALVAAKPEKAPKGKVLPLRLALVDDGARRARGRRPRWIPRRRAFWESEFWGREVIIKSALGHAR